MSVGLGLEDPFKHLELREVPVRERFIFDAPLDDVDFDSLREREAVLSGQSLSASVPEASSGNSI